MRYQIRELTRVSGTDKQRPYWTAVLVKGDVRIPVHSRYGSWMAEVDGERRHVLPGMAARLQEKVRPLEKAERKLAAA